MRLRAVALLAPLACAALPACSSGGGGQDSLPDPGAALPPASFAGAPSAIDGLYKGSSTRYQADSRACPHPGLVNIYVQDRQFTYRWNHGTDVPGSIDANGTVSGAAGDITISGHQQGDMLTGDLSNGSCALHFTTRRRFAGA